MGDPDGYGRYGVLDRTDAGVLCHECGGWWASLGVHAYRAHGLTAAAYREAHGLPRTLPLVSGGLSRTLSGQAVDRVGSPGWRRLEEARDPQAAADARTPDTWQAAATVARRREAAERLPVRARAVRVCTECGAEHTRRGATCSVECARAVSVRAVRAAAATRYRPLTGREVTDLAHHPG